MNKKKDYFISLGAGHHQYPLIRSALSEGYSLIGIDQNMNSEGMSLCDIKIVESILNTRRVYEKISLTTLDSSIKGGFSASYGEALSSWAYLAERLDLKGTKKNMVEHLLDKLRVRETLDSLEKAQKKSFKQPKFIPIHMKIEVSELEEKIGYPMIIKPKNGYMKKDIFLIEDQKQLKNFIKKMSSGKNALSTMICEKYIFGIEITVVGLVEDSDFHLIFLSDKVTSAYPPFIELEHVFPSKLFFMREKIIDAHQNIVEKFQIECSPIVSEWKYYDEDLYLIEISPQIPGEYLGSFLIPKLINYDYFQNLVRLMTSRKIKKLIGRTSSPIEGGVLDIGSKDPPRIFGSSGRSILIFQGF